MSEDKNFKRGSAEILSDLLSDEKVKRVRDYVRGEEFRADRERVRQNAARRIKDLKNRYKGRTAEDAAREKDLTLRLADVEAEAAELRLRLSDLLEEEEKLRSELRDL